MNTIGFTKERDKNLINNSYMDDLWSKNKVIISNDDKTKVIEYLKNSNKIFSRTLAMFDDETYIGPYTIVSDGEWIWPSHFPYFLAKTDSLDEEFYFYLKSKKFNPPFFTSEMRKNATVFLEMKLLEF